VRVAEAPMRAVDHQAGRLVPMRRRTRPCLLLRVVTASSVVGVCCAVTVESDRAEGESS
jgi:hypothetical protein